MDKRQVFGICASLSTLCVFISLVMFYSTLLMGTITMYVTTIFTSRHGNHTTPDKAIPLWVDHFARHLLSYMSIFGSLWFMGRTLATSRYLSELPDAQESVFQFLLRMFFIGYPSPVNTGHHAKIAKSSSISSNNASSNALQLFICSTGLLTSYVIWGVLQERIITVDYDNERFQDSQFLVFANRAFGGIVAIIVVILCSFFDSFKQPIHRASVLDYGYSAVSNILSSWCQYEALKFLSFPTQVLGKGCKIIPVMLMGRLITRQTYKTHEYATASFLSLGVAMFLFCAKTTDLSKSVKPHSWLDSFSGIMLLLGYLLFDSFNSNWQDRLFKKCSVSSLQMMAGTNLWSCILTMATLFEQNDLSISLQFALRHKQFMWDVLLLSLCSAMGQLFIFYTIARFGAVTFVIIMTLRQAISILLSCLLYNHPLSLWSAMGLSLVFFSLFMRIYFASCIGSRPPKQGVMKVSVSKTPEEEDKQCKPTCESHPHQE